MAWMRLLLLAVVIQLNCPSLTKGQFEDIPLISVGNYVTIDPSAIMDSSLKGESGFIANVLRSLLSKLVGNNLHGNQIVNAEKQINGEYIDANTEEPYLNEADPDSFEVGATIR